jgi:hypothetical protein
MCSQNSDWSTWLLPLIATLISLFSLYLSATYSHKNIRLSIQQTIFKTVSEKAKDCNAIWEVESDEHTPHYKVVSELIISKEVIDKSFDLFKKNYSSITQFRDDFYYLLWKQLRTDLREWIKKSPDVAKLINNEYYSKQIEDLDNIFKNHYEKRL